jgi:hypothetical protein
MVAIGGRALEELESFVEALTELEQRHRATPGSGEFDGQRKTVQLSADLRNRLGRLAIEPEDRTVLSSSFDEESKRRRRRVWATSDGHIEWFDCDHHLSSQVQRLPARGQDRHARAPLPERSDELGGRQKYMFTVVDDDERRRIGERRPETLEPPGGVRRRNGACHRRQL